MGKRAQILTAVLVTFLLVGCGDHQSEQIDLRRINAETTVEESQSEGDHSGIVIELPENQDQSQTDESNRGNDEISGGILSEEESGENQIESGGTDETEAEQEFHLLFSGDRTMF